MSASRMSRLPCSRNSADRCRGFAHVTGSGKTELEEIYDRYNYFEEEKEALAG
jgi:hypothetical protein